MDKFSSDYYACILSLHWNNPTTKKLYIWLELGSIGFEVSLVQIEYIIAFQEISKHISNMRTLNKRKS